MISSLTARLEPASARDAAHLGAPRRAQPVLHLHRLDGGERLTDLDNIAFGDIAKRTAFDQIGVSCRICERELCPQRALPPLNASLEIRPDQRDVLPYRLGRRA